MDINPRISDAEWSLMVSAKGQPLRLYAGGTGGTLEVYKNLSIPSSESDRISTSLGSVLGVISKGMMEVRPATRDGIRVTVLELTIFGQKELERTGS